MAVSTRYAVFDYDEIKELQKIGHGSFGTVYKAKWCSQSIAVKEFRTEVHKDKIEKEIRNLCQVALHPNIINFYGVSRHNSEIFLIMEYANCGSLQKLLYGPDQYYYTKAHALSWMLQCARAIEYLHTMEPKPLLHRDLKPANLLLVNKCRTLKICDFGTVAVLKTHMTRAKGSVPWMAPEVMNGSVYTEKCDIFSFGITLWEVFARQQPYESKFEIDFAIVYHVIKGGRPELDGKWPEDVQNLIRLCWNQEPSARPDMKSVVKSLKNICKSFVGEDAPLGPLSKETPQPDETDIRNGDNYSEPTSLDCTFYGLDKKTFQAEVIHKDIKSAKSYNTNQYLIRKERAGLILIFEQFDNPNLLRGEMLTDRHTLTSTFSDFGYISQERTNCTSSEMIAILEDSARKSVDYDFLIVCILAQFADGAVVGSDGVPVPLGTFVNYMDSDSLKGKPKLLIVQGYQKCIEEIKCLKDSFSDVNALDMLTICACTLEYKTWLDILRPKFLSTFCDYISQVGYRCHILDILVAAEKKFMKIPFDEDRGSLLAPHITNTLQKYFYLPK